VHCMRVKEHDAREDCCDDGCPAPRARAIAAAHSSLRIDGFKCGCWPSLPMAGEALGWSLVGLVSLVGLLESGEKIFATDCEAARLRLRI
jgi:hypothetical protein